MISIIIPHAGAVEPLKECIENIKKNTSIPYEIIVVADKPSNETGKYLKEEGVRAIFNPEIMGVEPALNQGFKVGESECICLLTTDVEVTSGAIRAMSDALEAEPSFGWVSVSCEYTGFFTACSTMTRQAFEKVGLWDESYAAGCGFSDDDYLRRMWKAGYKPHIIDGVKVSHKHSESGTTRALYGKEEVARRFEKNQIVFRQKYGETGTNWDNLPRYQPSDGGKAMDRPVVKQIKLNLGSFVDTIKGWTNIDILPLRGQISTDIEFKQWDLRRGIPYTENSVDVVRASHLIEHLTLEEAHNFCHELYRVLKPGGLARIATPDARIIVKHFISNDMAYFNAVEQPVEYIQAPTQCEKLSRLVFSGDYGHKAIYDFDMLKNFLEQAGFNKVFRSVPGFSHSETIQSETTDQHQAISLYVEVVK